MKIRFEQLGEVSEGIVLKVDVKAHIVKVRDLATDAVLWIPIDWVISEVS